MSICHHQPLYRFVQELEDDGFQKTQLTFWQSYRNPNCTKIKWTEESKQHEDKRLVSLRMPADVRHWTMHSPYYCTYTVNKFLCELFNLPKEEICIIRFALEMDPQQHGRYLSSIYTDLGSEDSHTEGMFIEYIPEALSRSLKFPHNYPVLIPTLVESYTNLPYLFTDYIFVEFYHQCDVDQLEELTIFFCCYIVLQGPAYSTSAREPFFNVKLPCSKAILVCKSKQSWLYAIPWNSELTSSREEVVQLCSDTIQWCSDRCEGIPTDEPLSKNLIYVDNQRLDAMQFDVGFTEHFSDLHDYDEFEDDYGYAMNEPVIMFFGGHMNRAAYSTNFSSDLDLDVFFNPEE